MSFRRIFVVFRKELRDTLRDRRTLVMMIVLPMVLMPALMVGGAALAVSQQKKAEGERLRVALVDAGEAALLGEMLRARSDLEIVDDVPPDSLQPFIRNEDIHAALVVDDRFDEQVAALQPGELTLFYESDGNDVVVRRLRDVVNAYQDTLLKARLAQHALPASFIETVQLRQVDLATPQEVVGRFIGGVLPYLFLLFCYLGAMYPAIDLAAGEKERATLETLLTSPASRMEILLGKFGVVVLAGLLSAVIALVGMLVGLNQAPDMPAEILETVQSILTVKSILLELSLLLPLTMFFAGILLTFSVFAKSFKEAQSVVSPLSFLVIIPAALGMIPSITLGPITALIPILNVSLATKEIMAGTIQPELFVLVYASLIVLAAAALVVCSRYFQREEVLFRT